MSGTYTSDEKVEYALKTALFRTMQSKDQPSSLEKSAPPRIFPKNIMRKNLIEVGEGDIDEDGYYVGRSTASSAYYGSNDLVNLEEPELTISNYRIIDPTSNKITDKRVSDLTTVTISETDHSSINALPTTGTTYPLKNWFFRGHYGSHTGTTAFNAASSSYDGLQLAWDKSTVGATATEADIVPHLKFYLQVQTNFTNVAHGDNITYGHDLMKGLIGLDQNFSTTIQVVQGEGGGCTTLGTTGASTGDFWFTQATSGTLSFYGVTNKVNASNSLSNLATTKFPMISFIRYTGETGFGAGSGGGGGTATGGNADTISGSLKTVDFQDLSGSHGDGQILNWNSTGGTWMSDIYGSYGSGMAYRPNYSNALYIYLADGTLVAQVNFKVSSQANNACMVENHGGWFMNYQASDNDFVIVANKNDFQNNIISNAKNCDPSVRFGNANGNNPDGHPVFPTSITDSWPATNPMYFAGGGEDTWFIRTWKMGDDEYQQRQKLKNYIHNVAVIKDTGMPDFTDEGRLDNWKGKTTGEISSFMNAGNYIQAWKRDGTLIATMRINYTSVNNVFVNIFLDRATDATGHNTSVHQMYMMNHVNDLNFKCSVLAQTKNFGGIGWDAAGITNPDGGSPDDSGFISYRGDNSSKHNLGEGERDWFLRKYGTQTVQKSLKFDGGIRTNGGIIIMDGGKPDFSSAWSTLYDNTAYGNNSTGDFDKWWTQTLVKGRRIYLWRKSTGEYLGSTVIDDFYNNSSYGLVHFGRDWKWMCSSNVGWYERRVKLNIKYLEGGGTRNNHWLNGDSDQLARLAGHDIVMDLIYIPDHRKNPTGRLGIGTTSPEDRLHVKGGAIIDSDRGLNVKNADGDSLLRVKKFPGKEVYGNFNTTGMSDYNNVLYFFDEDENFVCELEETQPSHDHFFGPSPSTSGNSIYWSGGPQIIPTALIMMLDNKVPGNPISKKLVELGYGETSSWTSYSTLQGGSKWYMSINTVSKVQLGQEDTFINEPHHEALEIVGNWTYNQAKYGRCWINFKNTGNGGSQSRWQIGTYRENGHNSFAIRGGPSSNETTYDELDTPFFIRYDGEIGIGTTSPGTKLHIKGDDEMLRLEGTDNPYITFCYGSTRKWALGIGSSGDDNFYINKEDSGTGHLLLQSGGNGNVGIGTTSPAAELHIRGSSEMLRLESTTSNGAAYINFQNGGTRRWYIGMGSSSNTKMYIYTDNSSHLAVVHGGGSVGIGTDSQYQDAKLSINVGDEGTMLCSPDISQFLWRINNAYSGAWGIYWSTNGSGNNHYIHSDSNPNQIVFVGGGTSRAAIDLDDGSMYSNAWFRVKGAGGLYFQDYGGGWHMKDSTWLRGYGSKPIYMDAGLWSGVHGITFRSYIRPTSNASLGGPSSSWSGSYERVSIRCVHGIFSQSGYIGASDERIKKNIIEINDSVALKTLRDISCCWYNYIDETKDPGAILGFIAQQVKKHFPAAVKFAEGFIPNEMRELEDISWEEFTDVNNTKKYKLTTDISDCSGVKYQFYVCDSVDDDVEEEKKEIVGNSDNTFTFEKKWNYVYCYGKEVYDFHTLNKQRLFALNFSATQELDRQQQADKVEIAELKAKNTELENEVATLKSELAAIKKHLGI